MEIELIRNNKGGQKLCFAGHTYTKKSTSKTSLRWECSQRKAFKCKGALLTDLEVCFRKIIIFFHFWIELEKNVRF